MRGISGGVCSRGDCVAAQHCSRAGLSARLGALLIASAAGLAALFGSACVAGAAGSGAAQYGLTDAQLTELRALSLPLVLPTYVPPGFHAAKVTSNKGFGSPIRCAGYSIEYRDGAGHKFTFDGGGCNYYELEPDPNAYTLRVHSDALGDAQLTQNMSGCFRADTRPPSLQQEYVLLGCKNDVSPEELTHVFQSTVVLPK